MYDDHLEVFDSKLEQFQAQLASVKINKLLVPSRSRYGVLDSALVGLLTLHRLTKLYQTPKCHTENPNASPVKYVRTSLSIPSMSQLLKSRVSQNPQEEPYDSRDSLWSSADALIKPWQ